MPRNFAKGYDPYGCHNHFLIQRTCAARLPSTITPPQTHPPRIPALRCGVDAKDALRGKSARIIRAAGFGAGAGHVLTAERDVLFHNVKIPGVPGAEGNAQARHVIRQLQESVPRLGLAVEQVIK